MNIDEMPAGLEMDALIARGVMGWHPDERGEFWLDETGNWCGSGEFPAALPAIRNASKVIPEEARQAAVFEPSTNIAHAMEAVDVIKKSHNVSIQWRGDRQPGGWGVVIGEAMADGDSLPLAICRAALKAVRS